MSIVGESRRHLHKFKIIWMEEDYVENKLIIDINQKPGKVDQNCAQNWQGYKKDVRGIKDVKIYETKWILGVTRAEKNSNKQKPNKQNPNKQMKVQTKKQTALSYRWPGSFSFSFHPPHPLVFEFFHSLINFQTRISWNHGRVGSSKSPRCCPRYQ